MFGLRLGKNPRCVVTTTPRPIKLLRDLLKREGQDVAVRPHRPIFCYPIYKRSCGMTWRTLL